jgi:hypothetical protein
VFTGRPSNVKGGKTCDGRRWKPRIEVCNPDAVGEEDRVSLMCVEGHRTETVKEDEDEPVRRAEFDWRRCADPERSEYRVMEFC